MSAPDGPLYYLDAARSPEQRAYMEHLESERACVFCLDYVETHHAHPIEHRGTHWFVTKNAFPYEGTEAHYLIIPLQHVTSFDELPDEAGAELWSIKRMLKSQLSPLSTATVERSGDMRLNGGSVAHLHTHFVALSSAPTKTVRFKVSAPGTEA